MNKKIILYLHFLLFIRHIAYIKKEMYKNVTILPNERSARNSPPESESRSSSLPVSLVDKMVVFSEILGRFKPEIERDLSLECILTAASNKKSNQERIYRDSVSFDSSRIARIARFVKNIIAEVDTYSTTHT